MEAVELMSLILFILVAIFTYNKINPSLDWNYETGEKLLWFNNPFDSWKRKAIVLWKKKI